MRQSPMVEQSTFLTTASLEELTHLAASQSTRCPEERFGDTSASASTNDGDVSTSKALRQGGAKPVRGSNGRRETGTMARSLESTGRTRSIESTGRAVRSKSLSSLLGPAPTRASAGHARGASLSSGPQGRLLHKATFPQKEANYYDGFPVKPAAGWFQSLFAYLVDKGNLESKSTQSMLASTDLSLVETMCVFEGAKIMLGSTEKGIVVRSHEEVAAEFLQHAQAWHAAAQGRHPIVVEKRKQGAQLNRSRAMDLSEFQSSLIRLGSTEDCLIFQRFVPPRTNAGPSMLRIAWRDSMAPRGFRLKLAWPTEEPHSEAGSAGLRPTHWLASSEVPGTQAVELKSIHPQAARIAEQVAHFTQTIFHIQLKQLVVDLLQDADGSHHLVQVKSFTPQQQWLCRLRSSAVDESRADDWMSNLRGSVGDSGNRRRSYTGLRGVSSSPRNSTSRPSSAKRASMVRTAACAMCSCSQPTSKLTKRMTPKMMLETEHHLRKRGLQLFHVGRVRAMRLSQACPVCEACWSLYLAEMELCNTETRLARSVDIHLQGQAVDEAYVPFGGVLAAVRTENQQIDFSGCHRHHDTFRIYDPLPSPAPSLLKEMGSNSEVNADDSGSAPRRGGEAITYADRSAPVLEPVPPVVLQWRMLIHINRLVDIVPELQALSGSCASINNPGDLRLRLDVPWATRPHDFALPQFKGNLVEMSESTVHFLFTETGQRPPLHRFFANSTLRFSLLLVGGESLDAECGNSAGGADAAGGHARPADRGSRHGHRAGDGAQRPRQLFTSELSLQRMGDSPDGFLAQTWVIFCSPQTKMCQLKVTIGLVCDHTVSTEYVALRRYLDTWVPVRPYFSSDVLPMTWIASIKGDRGHKPAGAQHRSEVDASDAHGSAAGSGTLLAPSAQGGAPSAQGGAPRAAAAVCCERAAPLDGPLLLAPRPSAASTHGQ